jgi:hypothetical protein
VGDDRTTKGLLPHRRLIANGRELLKIVSAHGAVLKLETRPGVYLYFDMARRTFVNK